MALARFSKRRLTHGWTLSPKPDPPPPPPPMPSPRSMAAQPPTPPSRPPLPPPPPLAPLPAGHVYVSTVSELTVALADPTIERVLMRPGTYDFGPSLPPMLPPLPPRPPRPQLAPQPPSRPPQPPLSPPSPPSPPSLIESSTGCSGYPRCALTSRSSPCVVRGDCICSANYPGDECGPNTPSTGRVGPGQDSRIEECEIRFTQPVMLTAWTKAQVDFAAA